MDVVALYRWLGLGQKLAGGTSDTIDFPGTFANGVFSPAVGSRAYNQLGDGDYQEMSLSLQFGLPVGFRKELANVRNAQLKLAREHSRLEDMELDVQRELALIYRAKDTNYELAQDHANRWVASAEELRIQNALWKEGTVTIDRVLDARRRLAQSQIDYYRALCEYNKSIALMHRRKGSTLDYCGVQFDEGPWPAKAYSDADELARRRSAARTINYGYSRPGVVSETMPNEHGDIIYMDGDVELMPGEYIEGGEPTPIDPAIPLPMPNGTEMTDMTLPNVLPNRTSIPRMDLGVQQASFVEGNASANLLPPAEAQPGSQHVPARLPLPNMNGGAVPTNSLRGAGEMLSDQQPGAGYP